MRRYAIEICVEHKQMAMDYAKAVVETVDYTNRGQIDKEKAIHDHYVGKLGEIAVHTYLISQGIDITEPDFAIHKIKSWDDDLYIGSTGIAVKTQDKTLADRFGLSWTFHVRDPILKQPNKIVYFVLYTPEIMYIYPEQRIKDLVFKPPVLERLVPYKKVVYAIDLKENNAPANK
jgi:hypothetical protein